MSHRMLCMTLLPNVMHGITRDIITGCRVDCYVKYLIHGIMHNAMHDTVTGVMQIIMQYTYNGVM